MELNDQQKQAVRAWVAGGMGLSDIQKRLREEFGVSMTYMDVRFLVLDLGVQVRDKPAPKPPPPPSPTSPGSSAGGMAGDTEPGFEDELPAGAGGVSVEVDRITKPGAVVSGSAVFSDGVKASWFVDQYGRLGLEAGKRGYQPSREDIADFQEELRKVLAQRGF